MDPIHAQPHNSMSNRDEGGVLLLEEDETKEKV
jgi:hypothetical protein